MPRTLDVIAALSRWTSSFRVENGRLTSVCRKLAKPCGLVRCLIRCRSKRRFSRNECGDFAVSCRMKANARLSRKISESVPETISPCWSKSARGRMCWSGDIYTSGGKTAGKKLQLPPVDRRKIGGNSQDVAVR